MKLFNPLLFSKILSILSHVRISPPGTYLRLRRGRSSAEGIDGNMENDACCCAASEALSGYQPAPPLHTIAPMT